jgi:hypothetical protein
VSNRVRSPLAEAFALAGGAALVTSACLPWIADGPGKSLHGHAFIDAVIALGNTRISGGQLARLAVCWYVIPALGALTWLVVGTAGVAARVARLLAISSAALTVTALLAFGRVIGYENLAAGPYVAIVGALLVNAGAIAALITARRATAG